MTVLDRIRELASEKNISLAELERRTHLSSGSITKWGKSSPSIDKLKKVADFFNVTTDYLIGRNQTPKNATKEETKALEKILREDAGLTFTDEPITAEDRAAIEGMITSYFWSKGRNRIKYMDDDKE